MRVVMILVAVLCFAALAADDVAAVPKPSAGSQSSVVGRQSPVVGGADAVTIPQLLSYQGKLTDTAGRPVPNGNYSVMFKLYTVPSGGSAFWSETQSVTTRDGLFSVLLGSVTPIGSVPDAGALYLGMAVGGGVELAPRIRIASVAYAYKADTANYALAAAGGGDNAWVRGTPDSVLFTIRRLGLARGGASNMLYGSQRQTHVNLGVSCTTGTSGQNYSNCTVAGGYDNGALASRTTVGGGSGNTAGAPWATIAGGQNNYADDNCAVGGGAANVASGPAATIPGGLLDTAAASYSFATGNNSTVPSSYSNSAAFNGQTATASNQTRVGALSKASGTFTIDHPLDPGGRILNHYFIEGPEMRNVYEGATVLDGSGRAEVRLPDYFDALNRSPHVQVTGVGTFEVYVAEKVAGNRFVIGGKPGAEVFWAVTGERKDISAEVTRRMMPVEQPKTDALADRMLDDEFLSGCMEQLEREGKAQGIDFRTAAGRAKYEKMKQDLREAGQQ